jgi:tellurite resistance protein
MPRYDALHEACFAVFAADDEHIEQEVGALVALLKTDPKLEAAMIWPAVKYIRAMNEGNKARNERLAGLELRCAQLEATVRRLDAR